jgi:acetolactate synthase-1/2/3 large subunit
VSLDASGLLKVDVHLSREISDDPQLQTTWQVAPMTGAELIVSILRQHGIDWTATLCGHGLDPLFFAARESGMRLVDTRNEQTASYLADAHGRLTRRPGVCAVSSGVALVNALAGVANAWFDHGPMLLISGAAATGTAGKGHFQDMDQAVLARPLCKLSHTVTRTEEIHSSLTEALRVSTTFPCGPVHLTFPTDVQNADVPESHLQACSGLVHEQVFAAADNIDTIAAALYRAEAPVVIAGSSVFYADAGSKMLGFCQGYEVPIVTPIWDRGSVSTPSDVFLGVVGAATGGPELLNKVDCIVMAAADVDYRVGYLQPPAIRPDARVLAIGNNWSELADACADQDVQAKKHWLAECRSRRDRFRAQVEARAAEQSREGLHAIHIIEAIRSLFTEAPVLLIDGGSIGQWAHQLLCSDRYPGDWLTCGRSAVVGWGVGGAMAARLAFPDRPVILLSGDGAFTFNLADLESAVRQRLGFVAVVADDQGWGITRTGHLRQFGTPIASSLGSIALDQVAGGLGARGVRATTPTEVEQELRLALDDPTAVTVIHVPIVGGNPS